MEVGLINKKRRIIGDIIATATGGYSIELLGGGVMFIGGTEYDVGDRVLIEDGNIIQKLEKLPMLEITI